MSVTCGSLIIMGNDRTRYFIWNNVWFSALSQLQHCLTICANIHKLRLPIPLFHFFSDQLSYHINIISSSKLIFIRFIKWPWTGFKQCPNNQMLRMLFNDFFTKIFCKSVDSQRIPRIFRTDINERNILVDIDQIESPIDICVETRIDFCFRLLYFRICTSMNDKITFLFNDWHSKISFKRNDVEILAQLLP